MNIKQNHICNTTGLCMAYTKFSTNVGPYSVLFLRKPSPLMEITEDSYGICLKAPCIKSMSQTHSINGKRFITKMCWESD